MGVFLGPAAGCPVLCGHRGCRGRWPVLRTADSQSLLCQGLSLCSPRSAARPCPRAFPRGFPVPQNPRSLHRLHPALAATVAELTLWTGGDGRPTRGLCGFPGLCSPPTLWTLTVDTRAWRGPSLGPGSWRSPSGRGREPPSEPACRLSPQPLTTTCRAGLPRGPCPRAQQPSLSLGPHAFFICSLCIPTALLLLFSHVSPWASTSTGGPGTNTAEQPWGGRCQSWVEPSRDPVTMSPSRS